VLKKKNGKELTGNIGFSFSPFGSNGTDYTLVVRPTNPNNAIF
jgi:hypothetical protein